MIYGGSVGLWGSWRTDSRGRKGNRRHSHVPVHCRTRSRWAHADDRHKDDAREKEGDELSADARRAPRGFGTMDEFFDTTGSWGCTPPDRGRQHARLVRLDSSFCRNAVRSRTVFPQPRPVRGRPLRRSSDRRLLRVARSGTWPPREDVGIIIESGANHSPRIESR